LAQLTKVLVFASLAGALAFESWQGRFSYPYLPMLTALAAIAAAVGSRLRPRHTAFTILLFAYWFPLLFVAATSRPFLPPFFLIWSGALAGLIAGDPDTLTWSFPRKWRLPLVLWALAVAFGWPLVAFREVDFESFALVERYHVSNTGIGGSPTMIVTWMADVAVLHLIGLLWFDWLCRRTAFDDTRDVQRWIALPLAIGVTAGAVLALYQGTIDPGFLSGNVWPSMGRAAGPLIEANAFGMIAALWSTGLLAFTGSRRIRLLGVAGALLCWGGLWMTGSRTALLAGFIALVPVAFAAIRQAGGFWARKRELSLAAAALVVAAGIVLALPNRGPLDRLRYMPTFAGDEGVDWLVREFWDRSSYGGVAAKMIAAHPSAGIGLGLFHMMGADYIRVHLHEVPPDNAQNWWRHNLVEMGVLGAAGLVVWSLLFAGFLARSSGDGATRLPAAALKGALVSIGLASMMGMPAQSLPVVITFWTFAFWYTRLVERDASTWSSGGLGPIGWVTVTVVVAAYLGMTVVEAQRSLRPPMRATVDYWPYAYGVYDPPERPADGVMLWTERHGVAVIPVGGPIMMLTVRAEHPDLSQHPVRALVKINGQTAVDMKLSADVPVLRKIDIGSVRYAVIDARVDRTWRTGKVEAEREIGLAISWKFLLNQNDAGASSSSGADNREVEKREQALVEPVDVGVDGLHELGDRLWQTHRVDALQPAPFGNRGPEMDVDALEAGRHHEKLQRVGMQRPHVRDVADVALEERHPTRGVDGLEHDRRAGAQLRVRGLQQTHKIVRLAVLHDLQRG
jgi:hypothetical protein